MRLAQTIFEKNPWNTLGIFNKIKHVFCYFELKWSILGLQLTPFPSPPPIIQCCDTLETRWTYLRFFNIARGSGGRFPLKTSYCFKGFFRGFKLNPKFYIWNCFFNHKLETIRSIILICCRNIWKNIIKRFLKLANINNVF